MANPIPVELRKRIVEAFDQGDNREEIAERFGVGVASITRLLTRRRTTGSLEPSPRSGGHAPILDERASEQMREWIAEQSDLTLGELRERLESIGCFVKKSAIGEKLNRMGLSRKKKLCMPPSVTGRTYRSNGRFGRRP